MIILSYQLFIPVFFLVIFTFFDALYFFPLRNFNIYQNERSN